MMSRVRESSHCAEKRKEGRKERRASLEAATGYSDRLQPQAQAAAWGRVILEDYKYKFGAIDRRVVRVTVRR